MNVKEYKSIIWSYIENQYRDKKVDDSIRCNYEDENFEELKDRVLFREAIKSLEKDGYIKIMLPDSSGYDCELGKNGIYKINNVT